MSVSQAQIGMVRVESLGSVRWTEISLIAGIVLSVLAFGGTEAASFAIVEVLFAATAIVFLALPRPAGILFSSGMLIVPTLLISLVLLQLCPLPVSLMRRALALSA